MSLLQVEVVYDGEWHGSIVEDNSAYQIEGFGSKTLNIMNSSKVSVAISKKNHWSGRITVKILEDGVVKRRAVGDVRDDFVAVEYNGRD